MRSLVAFVADAGLEDRDCRVSRIGSPEAVPFEDERGRHRRKIRREGPVTSRRNVVLGSAQDRVA